MRILISNSSPDPIYEQIVRQIKGRSSPGIWPKGSPFRPYGSWPTNSRSA